MLLQGDALEQLKTLQDNSIQCCVTSPPYYQLRDYGINGQIGLETTPQEYIQKLTAVFSEIKTENWFIEAHQFRIKAQPNDIGKPTPEGIHRDGVDFVLMAIINRRNITGGLTKIYNLEKKLKNQFLLDTFLDIALVDDHQVYHSVTEIQVEDVQKSDIGLRDVLVITFKKA